MTGVQLTIIFNNGFLQMNRLTVMLLKSQTKVWSLFSSCKKRSHFDSKNLLTSQRQTCTHKHTRIHTPYNHTWVYSPNHPGPSVRPTQRLLSSLHQRDLLKKKKAALHYLSLLQTYPKDFIPGVSPRSPTHPPTHLTPGTLPARPAVLKPRFRTFVLNQEQRAMIKG